MFRKITFAMCLLAIFSLVGNSGQALAGEKTTAWQVAFDPSPDVGADYFIWSMEAFNSKLYVTVSDFANGLRLFRSHDGKVWEQVTPPGFGVDPGYTVSWDMVTYQGKLYVAANGLYNDDLPGIILRSANGVDWEPVFVGDSASLDGNRIDKLGVFNGMIYATSAWTTGQIWRSPNGDPGTWENVNPSFGDGVWSTSSPTEFKGYLYFSGYEGWDYGGLRVWRSADGLSWESVGQGVLDQPGPIIDRSLAVYKDYLYLSTIGPEGGLIYRTRDGLNWELVVEDGFGDPYVVEIDELFTYEGDLYATSWSWECYCAKIWRTHTGDSQDWVLVNQDGLGIYTGPERNASAIFKGELYIANTYFYPSNVYKMVVK